MYIVNCIKTIKTILKQEKELTMSGHKVQDHNVATYILYIIYLEIIF